MRLPTARDALQFFNIYATGVDTPFDVTFDADVTTVNELFSIADHSIHFDFVDGDGSVPTHSSRADGLVAADRLAVPDEHLTLMGNEKVARALAHFHGTACSFRGLWSVNDGRSSSVRWLFDVSADERRATVRDASSQKQVLVGSVAGHELRGDFEDFDGVQEVELTMSLDCMRVSGVRQFRFASKLKPLQLSGTRVAVSASDNGCAAVHAPPPPAAGSVNS